MATSLITDSTGEPIGFHGIMRDITERKQAEVAQERRTMQLQTAAEVSRAISSILNVDELLPQVVQLIRARFDLYYTGLFLVDQTGEWTGEPDKWAVLRAGTGEAGRKMVEAGHKLEVSGTSMIGRCVANGKALITLDVGQEAARFENPLLPDTRSELALPLIGRGQMIGALTIQSAQVRAFSDEDITIFQTMADQLANAISNAHLFEQSQEALREVQAVQRLYLERAWADYLTKSKATAYETVRPGAQSLGDATLPEIEQALQRQEATVLTGDGLQGHSAVVVPLTMRGAAIGALGVHDENGARQWTEDEIALIESVAERMALAAENLRLLDDTQRRAAQERLLNEITARIRSTATMDAILNSATREISQATGAGYVAIDLELTKG